MYVALNTLYFARKLQCCVMASSPANRFPVAVEYTSTCHMYLVCLHMMVVKAMNTRWWHNDVFMFFVWFGSNICEQILCLIQTDIIHSAMPRSRLCQHCYAHRSSNRRLCAGCSRLVAPGCWPEQCLVLDAFSGDRRNVCRTCWDSRHRKIFKMAAQNLHPALEIVLASEY